MLKCRKNNALCYLRQWFLVNKKATSHAEKYLSRWVEEALCHILGERPLKFATRIPQNLKQPLPETRRSETWMPEGQSSLAIHLYADNHFQTKMRQRS